MSGDQYVCTLSASTLQKAREELNENPADRMAAVSALREWILQQPHLRCSTETGMLLRFLRSAKFSQLRARKMITNYLTAMTTMPDWFINIDPCDPNLLKVLNMGTAIPLPERHPNGCKVLLYRMGVSDLLDKSITVAHEIRTDMILGHYIGLEEELQVHGYIFIFDFSGSSMKHMSRWSMDDLKKWNTMWQDSFPGRFKAFHYYNLGVVVEAIMAMGKNFLSKKFQERIILHDNMESIYKHVPMDLLPEEYLPDDYNGPSAGPIADIISDYKAKVCSPDFRKFIKECTSEQYGVDLKKMPKTSEPQSSYRKIAVD